jgi:hypothetical protein
MKRNRFIKGKKRIVKEKACKEIVTPFSNILFSYDTRRI